MSIPFMVGVDDQGRTVLAIDDGENEITIALRPQVVKHLINLLAAPNEEHFWLAVTDIDDDLSQGYKVELGGLHSS